MHQAPEKTPDFKLQDTKQFPTIINQLDAESIFIFKVLLNLFMLSVLQLKPQVAVILTSCSCSVLYEALQFPSSECYINGCEITHNSKENNIL